MTEPLVWPVDLVPYKVAFYLQAHRGGSESPFSRVGKFYALSAPRWVAKFTFRGGYAGITGESAFGRRLDALIASLQGVAQVRLYDFRRHQPLQPYTFSGESLTHQGALKGAVAITLAGYHPGSLALLPGEYVDFGDGRPHIVVDSPGVADGSGNLAISFQPPLRSDRASGGVVSLGEISGVFRLAQDGADDAGQNETEVGGLAEYALMFVEDLTYGA